MSLNVVRYVDINADLGESFGHWTLGDDAALVKFISSANVACGLHAGDPAVIDETVARCKAAGVAVGAQPGFPDLQGFGRRALAMSPREIEQSALYQIGALAGFCAAHGVPLTHVKPHGALYNIAAADGQVARAIARGVARFRPGLALVGLAGSSAFAEAASAAGLAFISEAFADRRYLPDGTLQPREVPGSLIDDPTEAAAQALSIVTTGSAPAIDGTLVPVVARTICFHGDTPGAPAIVAAARARLEDAGVVIRAFAS
ncbi:MAG: 5-oxoprolinase subunit PxpA [Dehalococcoidia bacterium]